MPTSWQTLDHVYAHLLVVEILYCKLASRPKYFVQMEDMMKSIFMNKTTGKHINKNVASCLEKNNLFYMITLSSKINRHKT